MEKQDKLQEKVVQYQILQNRIEGLMKRRELLLAKMIEIETTINSMEEIKEGDVLLTLGSGIHIPGVLKKTEKVIAELGANVAIEEDTEKIKNILEKRKKVLENGLRTIGEEIIRLNDKLISLEPEIRGLLKGVQA